MAEKGDIASTQLDSILNQLNKPTKTEEICPVCGMTREQLETSELLGCQSCLRVFKRQYAMARKRRGIAPGYMGKIPRLSLYSPAVGVLKEPGMTATLGTESSGAFNCSSILAEIQSAVLAEDFERAALLRDSLGSGQPGRKSDDVV